jgi:hypothetical protein
MRHQFAYLWSQHRFLLVLFLIGGTATLFFAVRLVAFWIYWAEPAHHRAPLEGWMTVGFVARSWHLPPEEVLALTGVALDGGRPVTLAALAAANGESLSTFIARLETALADHAAQEDHGTRP